MSLNLMGRKQRSQSTFNQTGSLWKTQKKWKPFKLFKNGSRETKKAVLYPAFRSKNLHDSN